MRLEVRGRKVRGLKANCRVPAAPPVWMWRPEAGVPGAGEVRGRKAGSSRAGQAEAEVSLATNSCVILLR
jgi:hypothetical protein